MPGVKKNQGSLDAFFKPVQSASSPALTPSQPTVSATLKTPSNFPHPALGASSTPVEPDENGRPSISQPTKAASVQRGYTSSLSPPSSTSDPSEALRSPLKASLQPMSTAVKIPSVREVPGSDNEDSDSDSSLEDLSVLLQSHHPENSLKKLADSQAPSTPVHSRAIRNVRFHTSPLPVLPKYKFDLKSLARQAQKDDATEASSKRVKAMMTPNEETTSNISPQPSKSSKISKVSHHHELLESVVADTEGGEVHKVTRALKRTEATLPEYRWYFFETQVKPSKPVRSEFPKASIPETWHDVLKDPQMRYQTFVSGFAEDMVGFKNTLPDEIFMWMIDELCWESDNALRNSYSGIIRASSEQISRLVVPNVIQRMFRNLGGTSGATTISQVIQPVHKITSPYGSRNWANLRSVVKFLGQVSGPLHQTSRIHSLSMLLRLAVDRVVSDNIDLYDLVQQTIFRLCRYDMPDDSWELFCQQICKIMFDCIEQPTFRLRILEVLPSTSPRAHDLRRRLAMSFYLNDISYAARHSHHTMDLNIFIDRLNDKAFDATAETDYRELAALISLLDIAVDDARSVGLDLTDRKTEDQFDDDIEAFSAAIKDIIRSIGNPGAGFISKIEAKEVLELVSQRIGDTLRSRPKARQTLWDVSHDSDERSLDGERDFMKGFLSRRNAVADANAASKSDAL